MAEADILARVLVAVTALPGACLWRQNTGVYRSMDSDRVVRSSNISGIADIMGVYQGRAIAIECKSPSGRVSQSQERFRARWEAAGGVYIIARGRDDALDQLATLTQGP